ncbi:MAG: diguanylate cyclase [Nitrospirota bacterium]
MNLFRNLGIRTKFLVAPIVVAGVLAVASIMVIAAFRAYKERITDSLHRYTILEEAVEGIYFSVSSNHVQVFNLLANAATIQDKPALYDRGKRLLEEIHASLPRLNEIRADASTDQGTQIVLDVLGHELEAYLQASITAVEMTTVDLALAQASLTKANAAYVPVNARFMLALDHIRGTHHASFDLLWSQLDVWLARFTVIMLAAILSMVLLAFAIGHFVARDLVANIRVMGRLATGDWTAPIPRLNRADEVGEMTKAIEVFRNAIRDLTLSEQRTKALNQALEAEIAQKQEAQGVLARQAVELEVQASHDVLTGLFNRRHFHARVEADLARTDPANQNFAVMLCDLDGFKKYNDSRGHPAGDHLLTRVAKNLKASTRGSDAVYRWGGDEFVVTVFETSRDGVRTAAERVRNGVLKLRDALDYPDLDVSIGVALYPEHGDTIEGLLRLADRALYIAKKSGEKIRIGDEDHALDERQIAVVFQPILDARLGEVRGYEALVREPQGRLSVEALFRKYAAIDRLTAFKCLCLNVQLRTAARIPLKRLFVNVDFDMLAALGGLSKPPDMEVVLEISESEAIHHIEHYLAVTRRWRDAGFKFAIDDFGAGFLSLPFIAQLIPDYIKLDRSTMREAVTSPKFRRILENLLVGLRNCSTDGIIVEGIETAGELEVVKSMGLYLVQGVFLGKPEPLLPPPDDLDALTDSSRRAA